jgi:hypothetical protein
MKSLCVSLATLLLACASSDVLNDYERAKLDPVLEKLFSSRTVEEELFDSSTRTNGEREYGVIIRGSNADDVRRLGIKLDSALGDVMTARVTKKELKKVLGLPSVRAVQSSSRNYPQ